MDKEIWIEEGRAVLYYTWKSHYLQVIPVRKKLLAAITLIKPNRGETLTEIADKLEKIRRIYAAKRLNRRRIWLDKVKIIKNNASKIRK